MLAALSLLVAACTTSEDDGDNGGDATAEEGGGGGLGTGVSEDTIKIGFSYVDLEALAQAGVLKVTHGPYEEIMQSLVDDLNANGGINGRQLEVVYGAYDAIGNEESLALCSRLTEDEQVFAVLSGFLGDNNLCVVEQHETVLVGGILSDANLERARAPWITYEPSAEHSIQALVQGLDAEGELDGRTIGVYGVAGDEGTIEAAKQALEDAGAEVAFEGVNDAPAEDQAAVASQDTTFAQRMQDEGVDAVVLAGQYIPAGPWDTAGFHPRLWVSSTNSLAASAFTVDFTKFPDVLAAGGPTTEELVASDAYKRCEQVYEDASGVDVLTPEEEAAQGESTGFPALTIACSSLDLFRAAAEAAGDELNQSSFREGVESVGEISLARAPVASYGRDKYDGVDELRLFRFNPAYEPDGPEPVGLPVGDPIPLS
jgi:Periplasmic binding protein